MQPIDSLPFAHNVKDKTDVLDWEKLPAGHCDMNFRPPSGDGSGHYLQALTILSLTAACACILSIVCGLTVTSVGSSRSATVSLIVGLTMTLPILVRSDSPILAEAFGFSRGQIVLLSLVTAPFLWFFVTAASSTSFNVAIVGLLCLALPAIMIVADSMTTHAVHWLSANPRIDRKTMTDWREDWSHRFTGIHDRPARKVLSAEEHSVHRLAMRLRRSYRRGFFWLTLCFVLPTAGVIAAHVAGLIRCASIWVLAEVLFALIAISFWRLADAPRSFALFWRFFTSWLNYRPDRLDPPWVFQSPSGLQVRRVSQTILAVAVITSVATSLAAQAASELLASPLGVGTIRSVINESTHSVNLAALSIVCAVPLLIPIAFLLLGCYIIAAPALAAHELALEGPLAYEPHSDWSQFDGYAERLRNSRNKTEGNSLLQGYNPTHEYPVLLDTDLLFEHMHMMGATGIGKTALGLFTLVSQLIRRNDGPVIVIDCKGDQAFFNTVRLEAEKQGRTFKWFTNKPYRSTFVFNPFTQRYLERLTLEDVLGLVIQSLNLHHGEDYGRAWFSISSRILLKDALLTTMPERAAKRPHGASPLPRFDRVESFRDLDDIIRRLTKDDRQYQAASHLAAIVQSLADFEQLNLAPQRDPHHPAVSHAIHMPEVIREKQVIYFSLIGAIDLSSVGEIARLALYSALMAAIDYRDETGAKPRVYCICDEAQALVAQNLAGVLAQAREYGLACVLAHQSMDQLNRPGGIDLRSLVLNNTSVKQYFSVRDPAFQKDLVAMSGQVKYFDLAWDQLKRRVMKGDVGPRFACVGADEVLRIAVTESLGTRLETEDIRDVNKDANQSLMTIERGTGYSHFHGWFPVYTDWPISKSEHERRNFKMPWPQTSEQTIHRESDWPPANEQTIIPQRHPDLLGLTDGSTPADRLKEIKRRLDES